MNIPEIPPTRTNDTPKEIAQEVKMLRLWACQVHAILKETVGSDLIVSRYERVLEHHQERIATIEASHNELKKSLAFWKDLMDKGNPDASE
jgi:hypothetical protein